MQTVWIYKGLPGSGKSTKAKEMVKNKPCSIKRVNKDGLRSILDCSKHSKGNEKFVLNLRDHIINEALLDGKHVIVDDTNLNPIHEERIREIVKLYNITNVKQVQVKIKFFDVSPEECIKRDLQRENSVGEKVIRTMYNQYLKPKEEDIKPLVQNENLPHILLCDLDGTVAIKCDRSPFDGTKVHLDTENVPIVNLVKSYMKNGFVIFMSGREGTEICRKLTLEWLVKVFGKYIDFPLYMRKEGDHRKDSIIKKELFEEHILERYYVDLILDDRDQVVKMWREEGLTCLQVANGNF